MARLRRHVSKLKKCYHCKEPGILMKVRLFKVTKKLCASCTIGLERPVRGWVKRYRTGLENP